MKYSFLETNGCSEMCLCPRLKKLNDFIVRFNCVSLTLLLSIKLTFFCCYYRDSPMKSLQTKTNEISMNSVYVKKSMETCFCHAFYKNVYENKYVIPINHNRQLSWNSDMCPEFRAEIFVNYML